MTGDAISLARLAADANTIYMAGHDIFKRSTDGGKTWHDMQTDLPGTDLHGFAADPADATHLYTLVVGAGLFESRDGGQKWQPVLAQPPGAYGALSASASSPDQPATLYVATQLGVMRSVDGARTWHRKDIGLPEGARGVRAILAVPGNPHEWYAATGNGLYRSTDNGVTWAQVALQGQDLYAPLAASSSGPLRVYTLSSRGEVHRLEGATLMR